MWNCEFSIVDTHKSYSKCTVQFVRQQFVFQIFPLHTKENRWNCGNGRHKRVSTATNKKKRMQAIYWLRWDLVLLFICCPVNIDMEKHFQKWFYYCICTRFDWFGQIRAYVREHIYTEKKLKRHAQNAVWLMIRSWLLWTIKTCWNIQIKQLH